MYEATPNIEEDIRDSDAARLASLLYYTLDREQKAPNSTAEEVGEVRQSIQDYLTSRAQQDPEMGRKIAEALKSFQDPDPTLALEETRAAMLDTAEQLRRDMYPDTLV